MKDTTYKMFNKLLMDDKLNDITIKELVEDIEALKKDNSELKKKNKLQELNLFKLNEENEGLIYEISRLVNEIKTGDIKESKTLKSDLSEFKEELN